MLKSIIFHILLLVEHYWIFDQIYVALFACLDVVFVYSKTKKQSKRGKKIHEIILCVYEHVCIHVYLLFLLAENLFTFQAEKKIL